MAVLSQASHLGSLLLPHDAFQEQAAHRVEWSAKLTSKGSERPCIRSGLPTFLILRLHGALALCGNANILHNAP
jgi:hypothetical protein